SDRSGPLGFEPESRLPLAVARPLQRMPAGYTGMRVIFKQHGARGRQLLTQVSRDQCLKIFTGSQRVRAELRGGRAGNRFPDAVASLRDHLVIYLFISNLR